jgi:N-methylhydantoinase A
VTSDSYRIGVDIGGTFTDCVVLDARGRVTLAKALSTPADFTVGIWNALDGAAGQLGRDRRELLRRTDAFLHSTTIAENAIVDGNLARTGLITSAGFGYTLWATRGGYGRWSGLSEEEKRDPINTDKPPPLVPLGLVREVAERVDRGGLTLRSPDAEELRRTGRELLDQGVDAVAVSFLWSFLAPANESLAVAVLRELRDDLFVIAANEAAPTIGEYERTSTAVISAAVGPLVERYLDSLAGGLRDQEFSGSLLVMQSYGGLVGVDQAKRNPAALIESGPVAGLMGCARLGGATGQDNIISADMGGTTFKVGTVRSGTVDYQRESSVVRYHMSLPKVDVASFGLAGGSIVRYDAADSVPRIGPRSAGSYPGPACYGNGGTDPTVTDADAVLGYLNPAYFLGGHRLNLDASIEAFVGLARQLGTAERDAASAVYRMANGMIHDFLHKTTVQRGLDPREYLLFSTGGTAGMHLPAVAQDLGVAGVVIPYSASVHGAFGLVTGDVVVEEMTTRPVAHPAPISDVASVFDALTDVAAERLALAAPPGSVSRISWMVDMRFRRQVHILTVPVAEFEPSQRRAADEAMLATAVERFETQYERRYGPGSAYREAGVELVAFRVRATAATAHRFDRQPPSAESSHSAAHVERREAWIPDLDAFGQVDGYDFDLLPTGATVPGPAIIWTPITTVVLGSRQTAHVDGLRNLEVRWSAA